MTISPELTDEYNRLATAVLAKRTRTTYAANWRAYTGWCAGAGHTALPASGETVALFLTAALGAHKVKTARQYLCAIVHQHRMTGHMTPDLTRASAILTGAQRLRGERPVQKAAISVGQLREMIRRLDRPDPFHARDKAVLTFGFATALRRSSIAAALPEHVRFTAEGMLVHVPREKQDQTGKGRNIGVPLASDPGVCAVRAMRRWLDLRGDEPGYLFSGLWHGQLRLSCPMTSGTVADVVKRAILSIGLDPDRYGAHSLRAGFVTSALEAGAGEILTARHTGHRSLATLKIYMRPEDPFRGNVCTVIGL